MTPPDPPGPPRHRAAAVERFVLPGAGRGLAIAAAHDDDWRLVGDGDGHRRLDGCSGALIEAARRGELPAGRHGRLVWRPGRDATEVGRLDEHRLPRDSVNVAYVVGQRVLVKWYGRPHPGPHAETEILTALDDAGFRGVAPLHGVLEYRGDDGRSLVLAVAQRFLPGSFSGDDAIHRWLDAGDAGRPVRWCREIGALLAALHAALAPRFGVRRLGAEEAERRRGRAAVRVRRAARLAGSPVLERAAPEVLDRLASCELARGPAVGRVHGDAHLGQFLTGRSGTRIVDFEGDPLRSPPERREPEVLLRDLACLARGIANAHAWRALNRPAAGDWPAEARRAACEAYRAAADPAPAAPGARADADADWLRLLELEKACEEVLYARAHARAWAPVAEASLEALLADG